MQAISCDALPLPATPKGVTKWAFIYVKRAIEDVVPCPSSLHGVAFINVKFHLPGEFPLG